MNSTALYYRSTFYEISYIVTNSPLAVVSTANKGWLTQMYANLLIADINTAVSGLAPETRASDPVVKILPQRFWFYNTNTRFTAFPDELRSVRLSNERIFLF